MMRKVVGFFYNGGIKVLDRQINVYTRTHTNDRDFYLVVISHMMVMLMSLENYKWSFSNLYFFLISFAGSVF